MSTSARAILSLLLVAIVAKAQNSEDGQGSGSVSSGENPADAGSQGTQSTGFSMSRGSFIAIITVVVVVAVLGSKSNNRSFVTSASAHSRPVGSAILFFVAKKRQWEIRKSISRMSKRLTGRRETRSSQRQSRRQAIRMHSPPRKPRDLEKGAPTSKITSTFSADTPTTTPGWTTKIWGGKNAGST